MNDRDANARPPQPSINERLLLLEHDLRALQTQQLENDRTFIQINDVIRPSINKVIGWFAAFIITAAIPICVTVFKFGKYPDAESFVSTRAEYAATQKTLDERVKTLEVSRAEQEVRLQVILEGLRRLESKLDTALAQPRRRTRTE